MPRKPGTAKTGGRKAGTPNKLSGDVRAMILEALNELGGKEYLKKQAAENSSSFMTLVGKVVPTQVSGDPENPVHLHQVIEQVIVDPAKD